MILALNFRNSRCEWNGVVCLLLVGKQNPQRRCKERTRDNDDGKHDEKRCAAAQTGKGAYQLLDGFCRGLGQLFRGCGGCSGSTLIALLEHFPLCVLRGCFPCLLCRSFRYRRFLLRLWGADLLCISRPNINAALEFFSQCGVCFRLFTDGGRLLRWWILRRWWLDRWGRFAAASRDRLALRCNCGCFRNRWLR